MKNTKGFTLLEVIMALGIMSIVMVFLINGIYYIENHSNENQHTAEMSKVLQSNMEMILSRNKSPVNESYYYQDYFVKVTIDPFDHTDLLQISLSIKNSQNKVISAIVLYDPGNDWENP